MKETNLIKLYTVHGPCYVLAEKWAARSNGRLLAMFTKDGQKIHELYTPHYIRMRAKNCLYGYVHPENLSLTKKEAVEKSEAIYRELFPSLYVA